MNQLTCQQVLPHLESLHRGDAGPELTVLMDDHLARCTACRRRLVHLKQVSAMLSAWRPMPVSPSLKIETAEAVSDELGRRARRARQTYAARRRGRRPSRRRWPELTPVQRVASWLVIAALLFLGAAIIYRIIQTRYFSSPDESTRPKVKTPARPLSPDDSPGELP